MSTSSPTPSTQRTQPPGIFNCLLLSLFPSPTSLSSLSFLSSVNSMIEQRTPPCRHSRCPHQPSFPVLISSPSSLHLRLHSWAGKREVHINGDQASSKLETTSLTPKIAWRSSLSLVPFHSLSPRWCFPALSSFLKLPVPPPHLHSQAKTLLPNLPFWPPLSCFLISLTSECLKLCSWTFSLTIFTPQYHSSGILAFSMIDVQMVPKCIFSPDLCPELGSHIHHCQADISTWLSKVHLVLNLIKKNSFWPSHPPNLLSSPFLANGSTVLPVTQAKPLQWH